MQDVEREIYQELYNAIVFQAVTDYRKALRGVGYDKKPAEQVLRECERFFHSEYYNLLTKVPSEFLIEKLKKEVEDEHHSNSTNT